MSTIPKIPPHEAVEAAERHRFRAEHLIRSAAEAARAKDLAITRCVLEAARREVKQIAYAAEALERMPSVKDGLVALDAGVYGLFSLLAVAGAAATLPEVNDEGFTEGALAKTLDAAAENAEELAALTGTLFRRLAGTHETEVA